MTKFYIKAGFSRLRDSDLVLRASKILDALTDNENFPTPSPSLTILELALNDFNGKVIAGPTGNKAHTVLKRKSRRELLKVLKKLGFHINEHARSIADLFSSGFPLASFPNRKNTEIPNIPIGLILGDGPHSGKIKLNFSPVKGARMYMYRYGVSLYGELKWEVPLPSTSSRANIIESLTPSLEYWVQVKAVNSAGFSDWSNPAKLIAR